MKEGEKEEEMVEEEEAELKKKQTEANSSQSSEDSYTTHRECLIQAVESSCTPLTTRPLGSHLIIKAKCLQKHTATAVQCYKRD